MTSQRAGYLRRAIPRLGKRITCPWCGKRRKVIWLDVSTPTDLNATIEGLTPCGCLS